MSTVWVTGSGTHVYSWVIGCWIQTISLHYERVVQYYMVSAIKLFVVATVEESLSSSLSGERKSQTPYSLWDLFLAHLYLNLNYQKNVICFSNVY